MYDDGTPKVYARRNHNERAGDADREATSERLRRHHAEGRLDAEEFQERIDRCYQAKTFGELEQLVIDLPPDPTPKPRFQLPRLRMIGLVPIVIAIVAISAVTGGHHGHVGLWVLIPLFLLVRFSLRSGRPWSVR